MSVISAPDPETVFPTFRTWVTGVLRIPADFDGQSPSSILYPFAQVLNFIDDKHFTEAWVENFSGSDDRPRGKQTSLKQLKRKMVEYIRLHHQLKLNPDFWKITEQAFDESEYDYMLQVNRIVHLVLGCAILGDFKGKLAESLNQMEKPLQNLVVYSAQLIEEKSEKTDDLNGTQDNGNDTFYEEDSVFEEKFNKLSQEHEELLAKHCRLKQEYEKLEQSSMEEVHSNSAELKREKASLEDHIIDLNGRIDAMATAMVQKETELENANEKLDSFRSFEDEYRKMKDQNEELKEKAKNCDRLQRENENLKKVASDLASEKKNFELLRTKYSSLHQKLTEQEEERTKAQTLKTRISSLEHQLEDRNEDYDKLKSKNAVLENDIVTLKQDLASVQSRVEELKEEKTALQGRLSILDVHSPNTSANNLLQDLSTAEESSLDGDSSFNKLVSQEREIMQLRREMEEKECQLEAQMRDYNKAKRRIVELEADLENAQTKITELQETTKSLKNDLENVGPSSVSGVGDLKYTIDSQSVQIERLEEELRKLNLAKEDALKEKIQAEEEKKTFMDRLFKAKELLARQEQSQQAVSENGYSIQEFNSLRDEIEAKDRKIKQLEEMYDQLQRKNEEEQRLVSTSFYEQSRMLNDRSLLENDNSRERSFLSKLRAANATYLSIFFIIMALLVFEFCAGQRLVFRGAPETI